MTVTCDDCGKECKSIKWLNKHLKIPWWAFSANASEFTSLRKSNNVLSASEIKICLKSKKKNCFFQKFFI